MGSGERELIVDFVVVRGLLLIVRALVRVMLGGTRLLVGMGSVGCAASCRITNHAIYHMYFSIRFIV